VVHVARERKGRYTTVARVKVKVANGKFRAAFPLAKPALYRLRVQFAGDKRNAPARADFCVRAVRKLSSAGAVQAGR